ncbi:MAG: hypothetical protein M3Z27_02190 [Actinomycetota bacterium]|nr:hypothetical protein [Actinomycetota bacterium]
MQIPVAKLRSRLGVAGAVGARILASNMMEATLTGVAFKVQKITVSTQAVGPGVTEWKWEIEPIKAGRLPLHLAMTAFVELDGSQTTYNVRTFDRTLQVQSVPVAWYTKLTRFLSSNWAWIAGLIGLLAGAARWYSRRQQPEQPESNRDVDPRGDGRHGAREKHPESSDPSSHNRAGQAGGPSRGSRQRR